MLNHSACRLLCILSCLPRKYGALVPLGTVKQCRNYKLHSPGILIPMKLEIVTDKDTYQAAWRDARGCFTQSWAWGEVKRPSQEPLRLLVDGKPLQVLLRSLPLGIRFGYAPRAFSSVLLPSTADLTEISRQICQKHHLSHLVIEPDVWQTECNEPEWSEAGFKVNTKTIQPRYSRWLDLTQSEESMFALLAKDVRRRATRAREAGVEFMEDTSEQGLETFYQTLHGVSERAGFDIHSRDYYERIFREFLESKMVHLYFAMDGKTVLYALFALEDNGVFRRLYGGPSLEGRSSDGAQFTGWQAVLAAKKLGCSAMDFWGVSHPDDTKNPLAGVSRFKATLGGELITYWPQLIYVADPKRYTAYQGLLRAKTAARHAKRLLSKRSH
jgi:lipid II:glycine glycyltransferase (peptidoglycan interpeptide bridge formation enzyme)